MGYLVGIVGCSILFGLFAYLRARDAMRAAESRVRLDPGPATRSVRFDLQAAQAIPALAGSLAGVKWAKLRKAGGGHSDVGGVLVPGPRHLTWAPDDRAKAFGVGPWQLPWDDLAGAALRTATQTSSAVLTLTTHAGDRLELVGVDEADGLAIVRRVHPTP